MSDDAIRVSGRALAGRDGHRGQDASQPDEFKELSGQQNFTRNSPKLPDLYHWLDIIRYRYKTNTKVDPLVSF